MRFRQDTHAATVVCAAKGYSESYPKVMVIHGLPDAGVVDVVKVYHAGTKLPPDDDIYLTSGGCVLAVTGVRSTLSSALSSSYAGVNQISFVSPSQQTTTAPPPSPYLLHHRTNIPLGACAKNYGLGC